MTVKENGPKRQMGKLKKGMGERGTGGVQKNDMLRVVLIEHLVIEAGNY